MTDPTEKLRELMPALESVAAVVADSTRRTEDTARLLQEKLEDIGRISAVIRSVARQSKLLALNATIEAVREKDEGRGFGVVATEMKFLATQADEGASQIERYLADALTAAAENRHAVAGLSEAVSQGLTVVGKLVSAMATLD